MSRTQDRSPTIRHRPLPGRRRSLAHRHNIELIEAGRRYSLGRRDDVYCIWEKRNPAEVIEHRWVANARREFRWLERQARLRRRGLWVRLLVGTILVVAVAAPVALDMYADGWFPAVAGGQGPQALSIGRYVNPQGGYAFRVPEGWDVRAAASTTEVSSPTGSVTISIQIAPEGDIEATPREFVAALSAGWTDTTTEKPRTRTVGGLPASSVGGTAVDETGAPIRFLSIVVDSGTRNHAISVSVPAREETETFLPEIEEILASFTPLDAP